MNRDMMEDGAAVAECLRRAYLRGDSEAVMAEIKTLVTKLTPYADCAWWDDRRAAPINGSDTMTPEEFVLYSASDSHGRYDPNVLHATAKVIKASRGLRW